MVDFPDWPQEGPAVSCSHRYAISRVGEDHPTREQEGKEQHRPEGEGGRDCECDGYCEQGDLACSVAAEPEQDSDGIDLPRLPDDFEEASEVSVQQSPIL